MEQWKEIRNYNGKYLVSNYGRIKSLRCSPKSGKKPYILKPTWFTPRKTNEPFLVCSLYMDKKTKNNVFIHKLVAEYFVTIDDFSKTVVKHIDGDRSNNHHSNLMWIQFKESRVNEKY